MLCLYGFIICNECTTLVWDIYNEGGYACAICYARGKWANSVPSSPFFNCIFKASQKKIMSSKNLAEK